MANPVVTRSVTRRHFLRGAGTVAGLGLLQACASGTPAAPTSAPAAPATAKPAAQATAVPPPATAAPVATSAPTPAPTKPAGPKKGGTFTVASGQMINNFDPYQRGFGNYLAIRAIWNSLAHYDMQLKLQPELAEKWEISTDAVTLTLRQGVTFHTGREFTSEDVKASVEFGAANKLANLRWLYSGVKQVETPAKYTAILKFDKVRPSVYDLLDTMSIIDKETIADSAKQAIGTGPFKLSKYVPNDSVEMVSFADYWDRGKPYVDKYVVRLIPDLAALVVSLESNAVDCIWQPNFVDIVRLKGEGGKYVVDMGAPGNIMGNIMINCKREPYTDKKVRQAIAWSIDRVRFCKTALQGLAQPTCLMWPKFSWAYFADLEGKVGYDLDKAKALLKEAGLEKGFNTEILVGPAYGQLQVAQILQADLKKIGVEAKIANLEQAVYNQRFQTAKDWDLVPAQYGLGNLDPGSLVTSALAWYTGKRGGPHGFESATYDALRDELQSTLDQEKRKVPARKIQELALDECFNNPVGPIDRPWAYNASVKDMKVDLFNCPYMAEVWLDH